MTVEVTGVHPYADEFPMASEDEIAELAESIATVGLIHPIVLTPDGLVLDGRNRRDACERVGVEPGIEIREGSDDDYKEFVIGVNTTGRRESMTVQIAAASVALILGQGKRKNGRWERNTITRTSGLQSKTELDELRRAGMILDVLGRDPLGQVRDGTTSLNAVYEFAIAKRNEAERAAEEEANAERYEAEAKDDLEANAPDYAAQVADGTYDSHRTARAVWLEHDRAAKRERETREREDREALQRDASRVKAFLNGYDAAYAIATDTHPRADEVLNHLNPVERRRFYEIKENTAWPATRI